MAPPVIRNQKKSRESLQKTKSKQKSISEELKIYKTNVPGQGAIKAPRMKVKKKEKKSKQKKHREKLKNGDVVVGNGQNRWRVLMLLGAGGFGDVYKVVIESGASYAENGGICTTVVDKKSDQKRLKKGEDKVSEKKALTDAAEGKNADQAANPETEAATTPATPDGVTPAKATDGRTLKETAESKGNDDQGSSYALPNDGKRCDAGADEVPLAEEAKTADPTKKSEDRVSEKMKKENVSSSSKRLVKLCPIVEGKEYAMKTEDAHVSKSSARLKIELSVLLKIRTAPEEQAKHFVDIFDRGQLSNKMKFVVMTLVGPCLDDLRKITWGEDDFKKSTSMQISLQTLKSVEDLHTLGFIHRDIKPSNFACGLGDKESIIYMLDFGIARRIFKEGTNQIRPVRKTARFIGTVRYASRAAMYDVEQGRKDDLEAWLYMVFNLFDRSRGIPWTSRHNMDVVLKMKEQFFQMELPQCYILVPRQIQAVVRYINILNMVDVPEYKLINSMLLDAAKAEQISVTATLDWLTERAKQKRSSSKAPSEKNEPSSASASSENGEQKSNDGDKKKDEKFRKKESG